MVTIFTLGDFPQGEAFMAAPRREIEVRFTGRHSRRVGAYSGYGGLGQVARAEGNYDESAKLFRETLWVGSEIGDQWIMPRALGALASAAVIAADYDRAARLFGITAALRATSGISESPGPFRTVYEREESEVRSALSDEAFVAKWAEGQLMTRDEAVAYALEIGAP